MHDEVSSLSTIWIQATFEVEGITDNAFSIIKGFDTNDFETLKTDLISWRNDELNMLAKTLSDHDWVDNYLFGYIFTLVDDTSASLLIDQELVLFFEENDVTSVPLLLSIREKVKKLKFENYLDEKEYCFWETEVNKAIGKASC